MKYIMINEVIINLSQVQSVERNFPSALRDYGVKVTFINGKEVTITTNSFDYLFEGRFTKAKEEEYNRRITEWQEDIMNLIFINLKELERLTK